MVYISSYKNALFFRPHLVGGGGDIYLFWGGGLIFKKPLFLSHTEILFCGGHDVGNIILGGDVKYENKIDQILIINYFFVGAPKKFCCGGENTSICGGEHFYDHSF